MKLIASQIQSESGLTDLLTRILRRSDLHDALFRRSIEDLADADDATFVFLLIGQFAGGLSEIALRVICEPPGIHLDRAVRELRHRSLLEIRQRTSPWFDMPAMAREFAQQYLAGHILQTEISSATTFLRRWPTLIAGQAAEASEAIAHDLRVAENTQPESEGMLSALRVLATADPSTWATVARTEHAMGLAERSWEESYERAIEADPSRNDLLYEWSEATSDQDRRVELKVQAVSAEPANLALASRVATFLNGLYHRDRDRYSMLRWTALMNRVIDALDVSFLELDGEALSRLAWLYIHSGRANESRRVIERGLVVDIENESIRKLAEHAKIKF